MHEADNRATSEIKRNGICGAQGTLRRFSQRGDIYNQGKLGLVVEACLCQRPGG